MKIKTILVDDEEWILEDLKSRCQAIDGLMLVGTFTNPLKALEYAQTHPVQLAILDIHMPGIDGMRLGRRLRELRPEVEIIYSTGYEEYALESYKLHALSYILKPVEDEELLRAIRLAQKVIENEDHRLYIKTFGRFDVFVGDQLMVFRRAKAKELLALLVDQNGGIVSMEQVISFLWEDKSFSDNAKQLYRDAVCQLRKTLVQYHCPDVLQTVRAGCFVDTSRFHCDFYDLMSDDAQAAARFNGEYLFEYSWGENTLPSIYKKLSGAVL